MEFLKSILGEKYAEFEATINQYNTLPENKGKQIKLGNTESGEYVSRSKYSDLETEHSNSVKQLEELTKTLKGFDGVDIEKLKGEITRLTGELDTQSKAHSEKMAELEFNDLMKEIITSAKGRSSKSVMAELDLESLKSSKNQKEDILSAVNKCKESNAWLFESGEPIDNPVSGTNNNIPTVDSNTASLRAAMGLGTIKE